MDMYSPPESDRQILFFALEIMSGLSIVCRSLQHGEIFVNVHEEVKCFLMGQECQIIISGAEGKPEGVASKKPFSCCSGLVGLYACDHSVCS